MECEQYSLLNVTTQHGDVKPTIRTVDSIQCPHWLAVILTLLIVSGVITVIVINIAQSLKGIADLVRYRGSYINANSTFIWLDENFNVDGRAIVTEFVHEIKLRMLQYMFNTLLQSMMDTLLIL